MSENRYSTKSKQRESLLLFLGAFALLKFAVFPVIGQHIPDRAGNILCYVLWAGLALIFCRMDGFTAAELGFSHKGLRQQLICGAAVGAAVVGIFVLSATAIGLAPEDYLGRSAPNIPTLLVNCAFYLLIVGPFEEFIFRGYLMLSAEKALSPVWGILISSAVFGLSHLNGGVMQLVCTFLIGLAYAVSFTKLKHCTLLSVMTAHALHNFTLELIRWFFC